jgi:hypothetical protein
MSGLGYNQIEKGSSSKKTDHETKKRSYVEIAIRSKEKEEDKKFQKEDQIYTPTPRIFRVQNHQQSEVKISQEEEGFRKETPFIRYPTPKYQTIFIGLCYPCNNFWHKDVTCRDNNINKNKYEGYTRNAYPRRPNEMQSISYNMLLKYCNCEEYSNYI